MSAEVSERTRMTAADSATVRLVGLGGGLKGGLWGLWFPLKPEYQPIAPQPLFCLSFQPFGRIAIANCDAADNAMTEASLGEAYRAVREVVGG
jgi:hypothetical protein